VSDPGRTKSNDRPPRGGAEGPRVNLRKGIQLGVLVVFLAILFTDPFGLDPRTFIFGTMILVVVLDLLMLWRGDLTYTHFGSRVWSFRVNAVLLAIAVALFGLSLTDRF